MRKITSLHAKETLLKQTMALERQEREIDIQEEEEMTEELRKKKEAQIQLDEEMILRQEDAKRKYLMDEFIRDAEDNPGIPRSLVRLEEEKNGNFFI